MSWFNSGIASLAKNALSQAQKTIDRALDIQDQNAPAPKTREEKDDADNFFAAFGIDNANPSTRRSEMKKLEAMTGSLWGSFSGSFFETENKKMELDTPGPSRSTNINEFQQPQPTFEFPHSSTADNSRKYPKNNPQDPNQQSADPNLNMFSDEITKSTNFVVVQQPNLSLINLDIPSGDLSKGKDERSGDSSAADIFQSMVPLERTVSEPCIIPSEVALNTFSRTISLERFSCEMLEKSTDSNETIKQDCDENVGNDDEQEKPEIKQNENEQQVKIDCGVPIVKIDTVITSEPKSSSETTSSIELVTLTDKIDEETNPKTESSILDETRPSEQPSDNFVKKSNLLKSPSNITTRKTCDLDESKEMRDVETKSTDSIVSYTSSTGSFVKCMIEEAMKEQDTRRSNSPHSTSSSEKSDMVKLESEQNSGHTSGDEVETTTSSDVEIISMSSPNGDNGTEKMSLSPMKRAWVGKGPSFRRGDRAESPASDTSSVRDSPLVKHGSSAGKMTRILRGGDASNADSEKLLKKLAEMSEVLHARESQLLNLSRQNVGLQDKNTTLRSQLEQAEVAHAADTRDVTTLTEEFSHRLATMERNLQETLVERDSLKYDLEKAKEEMADKLCAKHVERMIKEKDTQIEELMQEGEKLSKQQLQQSNIIKKLRTREKETDNLIKQQKEKLEEQSTELERARKALTAKEEIERKQIDAIRQLTNTVQKHEKETLAMTVELEESKDKMKALQTTTENSNKELFDLRRLYCEMDTQVEAATLSASMNAKEELRTALEHIQQESRSTQEALITQIEDLQLSLSRGDQQARRREDMLKQELSDLQQRLQEAETRNQELTQNVAAATRPLLRQIENLQATFTSQTSSWEKVENNLTERLNKAQNHLSVAVEKERSATEKYQELNSSVSVLETQNELLRQEKVRLQVLLEAERGKLLALEEWKSKETTHMDILKQTYAEEISSLTKERKILEHQLDIEKTVVDAEKRKCALLQEQLKEKERKLSQIQQESVDRTTPSPTPSLSRMSSVSESFNPWLHEDVLSQSLIMSSSTNGNKFSLYEALRHNGAASLLENLQSQLKMREGEITQLQSEIGQLERVRESMALEMVSLSTTNEELDEELKQFQQQQTKFQEMEQKYNALLQMYGEKVEEADELRLDLIDVKEMYKAQISELLKKT